MMGEDVGHGRAALASLVVVLAVPAPCHLLRHTLLMLCKSLRYLPLKLALPTAAPFDSHARRGDAQSPSSVLSQLVTEREHHPTLAAVVRMRMNPHKYS